MKHLFEVMPVAEFLQTLPFAFDASASWQRKAPIAHAHLGLHRQLDGNFYVGAMPLLGRLTPQQLRGLTKLANEELHLTPWQGILIPHIAEAEGKSIINQLDALGFCTDPTSPAARLRACSVPKAAPLLSQIHRQTVKSLRVSYAATPHRFTSRAAPNPAPHFLPCHTRFSPAPQCITTYFCKTKLDQHASDGYWRQTSPLMRQQSC